ncbi:hypothetical protein MY11210_005469 [Beauveria gryllotalpidicola]
MSKIITVFGATGNQGGSVVDHILRDAQLSKEYKIRGITRDTSKPPAKELAQRGVEVVSADLNSTDSLLNALAGSYAVFLVTNYWEKADGNLEYSQGKNVADVAKICGVSYLIFSSLPSITEESKGRLKHVPHFDSKANIEKYIRASGLKCAFVMPGYYMMNLTGMIRKGPDGVYQLVYPFDGNTTKLPLCDAANDLGLFVKAALKHEDTVTGARILASCGYYTPEQIVETFSNVTGKKARFVQVTPEELLGPQPGTLAIELVENLLFIENPGYFLGASLDASLRLVDEKPTSWADFVKTNSEVWE